jgi:hypothetical protein
MNLQNLSFLEVYVLLTPLFVGALGLCVYWLTGWMDRREQHRHHPAE